jgi:cytochrome b561
MKTDRYPSIVRRLHWITVGLFLWQWLSRNLARRMPENAELVFHLDGLHTIGGVLILLMALTRLLVRARYGSPGWPDGVGRFPRIAATFVHGALYAIMIALPLTGLAAAQAQGFATAHTALSWIALGIIAMHVAAALWHRIVRQDTVFNRIAW